LNVNMAENSLEMEWEWLMSIVGVPQPRKPVPGKLEGQTDPIQWDTALQRLLAESPELELARAVLKADEITVEREKVQPIPNLVLRGSAGRNYETRETVYGLGAFIELPIFDRNQGTIRQAQADLRRQQLELRLTKLRLRRSLAEQFQRYRTALQHVDNYREILLPESQERYRLRLKSYGENRQAWPAVLEAQQDFFGRRLLYIDHLVAWRSTQVAIDGLLLVDGLVPPGGVTLPGHIDAVPKPR
ncbi:MAG: TolC family protein, partial [Nitrospirales bacterium]